MSYRGIVFDFDYTLGDATEAIYAGFVYGLTEMGYPTPTVEAVRETIGMAVPEAYRLLTGDPDPAAGARFYELFGGVARKLQAEGAVKLFPGARELLTALKGRGIKTAIVSTKRIVSLREILANKELDGLFDCVVGGGSVATQKPAPEGTRFALEKMGIAPENALYCGDTVIDGLTAQNAGVDFCAVLNGTTPAEAFGELSHVHIAENLLDLRAWLGV